MRFFYAQVLGWKGASLISNRVSSTIYGTGPLPSGQTPLRRHNLLSRHTEFLVQSEEEKWSSYLSDNLFETVLSVILVRLLILRAKTHLLRVVIMSKIRNRPDQRGPEPEKWFLFETDKDLDPVYLK